MKTTFQNQNFYTLALSVIALILGWNLVMLFLDFKILTLVFVLLQAVLLSLLVSKHQYARMGLLIMSVLWIAGPALSITGSMLKLLTGEDPANLILPLIGRVLILFLGLTLYHYTKTTVVVTGEAVRP